VTSQCAFDQLSVVYSRPVGKKEEGRTDRQRHNNIPSKSLAGDNKI